MRTVTPAFRAAVGSSETQPITKVTITWPAGIAGAPTDLSKFFLSVQPVSDLTTDAPPGTRLLAGYPARSATLDLGGAQLDPRLSMQQLFDAYSPASPLYQWDWTGIEGAKIVIEQGLRLRGVVTPETYVICTAYVDNAVVNRATGVVTLNLLDFRPKLSAVPALQMMLGRTLFYGSRFGLTSLTFIEQILAANGIYAAPQPRPGGTVAYYASLHGTLWPQVGGPFKDTTYATRGPWPSQAAQDEPLWEPGQFAGQVPSAFTYIQQLPVSVPLANSSTILMEGYVKTAVGGAQNLAHVAVTDGVGGIEQGTNSSGIIIGQNSLGEPQVQSWGNRSGSATVTGLFATLAGFGAKWYKITVRIDWTAATNTFTTDIWIDDVHVMTAGGAPTTGVFGGNANFIWITDSWSSGNLSGLPMECWQVTFGEIGAIPAPVFTPTAFLDASLNKLTATPQIGDVSDAWGLLQTICDAEFAVAGFDEDLLFRFKNRYNYPDVPGATITSLRQIKDLTFEVNEANRARAVSASVSPLAPQPVAVMWQATEAIAVPARGSVTTFATLTGNTVFVPLTTANLPNGIDPATGNGINNSYRANTKIDGTGANLTNLTFVVTQLSSTTVKIIASNPGNAIAFLVSGSTFVDLSAGTAAFWVIGTPVNPGPDLTAQNQTSVTVSSVYGSGLPALPLPDTAWRQDSPTVVGLCEDTLADYVVPLPVLTQFDIVGDSSLQLGDRVALSEQGILAVSGNGTTYPPAVLADDLFISGIHPTASPDGGFVEAITGRLNSRPGQWVLGVAGRSELGTTTWV